jgi:hypothetical protein
MYNGLVHLHNILRWVILLLMLIALSRHFVGMTRKRPFTSGDRKVGTWLFIAANIQFLIGLYQWFFGSLGFKLLQSSSFGDIMKDSTSRFWVMEHSLTMLIAVALISIGRGAAKKNIPDVSKHRRGFWFYLIALILILAAIPWPGRIGIGRPLLPGMQ